MSRKPEDLAEEEYEENFVCGRGDWISEEDSADRGDWLPEQENGTNNDEDTERKDHMKVIMDLNTIAAEDM